MQLPGRLAASTLGDLLGALNRERITGQLELLELRGPRGAGVPGRRHRIHLSHGLITGVETELPVAPIGEILRREGLVDAGAIGLALRRIKAGDVRAAGEILVADGFARPEFIRAGLRKQLKQRVDALFTIDDAVVAFHTARPFENASTRPGPLWPSEFLHGRPRARDRMAGPPSSGPGSAPRPSERPSAQAEPEPPRSRVCEAKGEDERSRARRLLGLNDGASPAEARRAFRRLAAELHPDRHTTASPLVQRRNAARFARISAAYHLLVA